MALNEFVQTALDEEGYEEGSDGYTKYGSWYGLAKMRTGVSCLFLGVQTKLES